MTDPNVTLSDTDDAYFVSAGVEVALSEAARTGRDINIAGALYRKVNHGGLASRAEDTGVTAVEPGCTCGGMAACQQCQDRDARAEDTGCRHAELPDTMWRRLREAEEAAERRLALLRTVVRYDDANHSDLPLPLLDGIRAEAGGPR